MPASSKISGRNRSQMWQILLLLLVCSLALGVLWPYLFTRDALSSIVGIGVFFGFVAGVPITIVYMAKFFAGIVNRVEISSKPASSADRISARTGTAEYDRQLQRQSDNAMGSLTRMPLVRIVCGCLAIIYGFLFVEALYEIALEMNAELQFTWAYARSMLDNVLWSICLLWIMRKVGLVAIFGTSRSARRVK